MGRNYRDVLSVDNIIIKIRLALSKWEVKIQMSDEEMAKYFVGGKNIYLNAKHVAAALYAFDKYPGLVITSSMWADIIAELGTQISGTKLTRMVLDLDRTASALKNIDA